MSYYVSRKIHTRQCFFTVFHNFLFYFSPESGNFTAEHSKRKCLATKLNECAALLWVSLHLRGGDLGCTGDVVPLKKLGGGDGGAFIPQYLENVLLIYNEKKG